MKTAREYEERKITKQTFRYIEYNRPWDHKRWDALRFIENPSAGLRFVGFVDQVEGDMKRIKHEGWYTDEFQDRCLRGVVYLLPHGKYVPGYACSDEWQGKNGPPWAACLSFADHTTNLDDAIRAADNLADSVAESEREYNALWHYGQDYSRAHDEIADAWSGLRELARERRSLKKAGGDYPGIMKTLEEKMKALLEIIRENKKLADDLIMSYDSDAFKEGAGL